MQIVRARLDDAEDIQRIEIECGLSPWTLKGYRGELVRLDSGAFVAKTENKKVIGFIIGRIPVRSETAAEIYNIGIMPQLRKLGVGSLLLAAFVKECEDRRVSEVWLEARASNQEALSFYRSNGFKASGIRPNFYENPREDAQLMTLKLIPQPVLTKS